MSTEILPGSLVLGRSCVCRHCTERNNIIEPALSRSTAPHDCSRNRSKTTHFVDYCTWTTKFPCCAINVNAVEDNVEEEVEPEAEAECYKYVTEYRILPSTRNDQIFNESVVRLCCPCISVSAWRNNNNNNNTNQVPYPIPPSSSSSHLLLSMPTSANPAFHAPSSIASTERYPKLARCPCITGYSSTNSGSRSGDAGSSVTARRSPKSSSSFCCRSYCCCARTSFCLSPVVPSSSSPLKLVWHVLRSEALLFSLQLFALGLGVWKQIKGNELTEPTQYLIYSIVEILIATLLVSVRMASLRRRFNKCITEFDLIVKDPNCRISAKYEALIHWINMHTSLGVVLLVSNTCVAFIFYVMGYLAWTVLTNNIVIAIITIGTGIFRSRLYASIARFQQDEHKVVIYETLGILNEIIVSFDRDSSHARTTDENEEIHEEQVLGVREEVRVGEQVVSSEVDVEALNQRRITGLSCVSADKRSLVERAKQLELAVTRTTLFARPQYIVRDQTRFSSQRTGSHEATDTRQQLHRLQQQQQQQQQHLQQQPGLSRQRLHEQQQTQHHPRIDVDIGRKRSLRMPDWMKITTV